MPDNARDYVTAVIQQYVLINSTKEQVWQALTAPRIMEQWMSETPITIQTNWKVGEPVIIQGPWYKTSFRNTGTVVRCSPPFELAYTHLSSLSRLPDEPGSYCLLQFGLSASGNQTKLELTISNFPTDAIYRHLNFYWTIALQLLKKYTEKGQTKL